MTNNPKPEMKSHSISFYVILGAALLVFIQTFSLLSPILLSFLLVLLISLAVNPVISRMRSLTGGRKIPTGLVAVGLLVAVIVLVGWALFEPMKTSVINLSEALPGYWERLQKPLIKIFVVLVTVFFGVVFMLMNPRPVFGAMLSLVPEQHHNRALIILQRIGIFVPLWAGATLLGMVTIGMLVFLLMWPIFGFMDALVLWYSKSAE